MVSVHILFDAMLEVPDGGVQPYELIKLARKKEVN